MILRLLRWTTLAVFACVFSLQSKAQCVDDFRVTTALGDTVVNICVGNASPLVSVVAEIRGYAILYVLTDANNTILDVTTNPIFNFRNAPPGVCRIYAATFKGRILNTMGELLDNAVLTTLCAGLSTNYVSIIRGSADESTISMAGGGEDTTFCSQDGLDDFLSFEHTPTTQSYIFVVTTEDGEILAVTNDPVNFEGAPAGICYVYGLSYDGMLTAAPGLSIDDNLSQGCYLLSDNRVEVTRVTTEAGSISTSDSLTQLIICVGDGESDSLTFISPGADPNANYTYIITTDQDTIVDVLTGNIADFEGADEGVCYVYGVAYSGNLTATPGTHISEISSDGACLGLTTNFVRVQRSSPTEGPLATLQGDTVVSTCPGDSISDIVTLNILSGTTPVIFIITDSNNVVLGISDNQAIDFENAGEGTCFIWRSSYIGNLTIEVGDELFIDPVSDGCYVISDNSVEVNRFYVFAGDLTTTDGDTIVEVCVGDGEADLFSFSADYNMNAPYTLVITNDTGLVLEIVDLGTEIDLEGAGSGVCRVYGVSYSGDFVLTAGQNIFSDDIATACVDISDNYVTFIRNNVDPGVIFTQYGTVAFTCPGDGNPDILYLTRDNTADTSIVIITNNSGVVLEIPTSDTVDVEGAGEGVCLIWGLSFDGSVTVAVGDTIMGQDLATGCHSLTEPVFVLRRVPYADTLATVDGDTVVEFCTSDGIDDILILNYPPVVDFPIEYVVTDTNGFILATSFSDTLNFEGVPAGVCRVYGVAYTGFFTGEVGQNIGVSELSDDCYAISENYVEVTRIEPLGGILTFSNGEDIAYTCPGDGINDVLHFMSSGGSNDKMQYVVTDENDVIIATPAADSADFEAAPIGVCRVWGIAFTGIFIGSVGDSILSDPMSDKCYGLSENFLTVVRDTAEAGFVSTLAGDTLLNVITSDTIPDVYALMATGASSAEGRFVVTNDLNVVLAVLMDNLIDFSLVPENEYRLYHISYTGDLLLSAGSDVTMAEISTGCYDVSDNFVRVIVTDNFTDDDNERGQDVSLDQLTAQGEIVALKLYPNPAVDQVYLSDIGRATRAVLINNLGAQIRTVQLNQSDDNVLNVQALTPGFYYVITFDDEGNRVGEQRLMIN